MLRFLRTVDFVLLALLLLLLAFILSGYFHALIPCSNGDDGGFKPWMSSKAALFVFLPVLVLLPLGILLIERRGPSAGRRVFSAVMLSQLLLLPAFPTWILTGDVLHKKAIFNGLVVSIPPALRAVLPLASIAASAFAVALSNRKSKQRLAVIAVAATFFALTIISNRRMLCGGWSDAEIAALVLNAPLILAACLVRSSITLRKGTGGRSLATELGSLVATAVATVLVLSPLDARRAWGQDELASFHGARLTPSGKLILFGRPKFWGRGIWGDAVLLSGVLSEPSLQSPLRARVTDRSKSNDLFIDAIQPSDNLALIEIAPLWKLLLGSLGRLEIFSISRHETVFARRMRSMWNLPVRSLAGGPGRSWIVEDSAIDRLIGETVSGSPISIRAPCVNLRGQVAGNRFVAVGDRACVINVDLERGTATSQSLPAGATVASVQLKSDGRSAVIGLWQSNPPTPGGIDYFLLDFKVEHAWRAIGSSEGYRRNLASWSSGSQVTLLGGALPETCPRAGRGECTTRTIDGRTFIGPLDSYYDAWWMGLTYPNRQSELPSYSSLAEFNLATGTRRIIATDAHDIQWLPDSIVFTEVTKKNERVVRYWPGDERRETLFEIEIPPYEEPDPSS
jgi:hypothetical protein